MSVKFIRTIPPKIRDRLSLSVLHRAFSNSLTCIAAYLGYIWILRNELDYSPTAELFTALAIGLHLPQLAFVIFKHRNFSQLTIDRAVKIFEAGIYAATGCWIIANIAQCSVAGIKHASTLLGLLITCGFIAGSVSVLSPLRRLAIINICLPGFSAGASDNWCLSGFLV